MLPPALAQLKKALEQKGHARRTTGEDQLLEELDTLDRDPEFKKSLDPRKFHETRSTSGPSNACPCCGR
jgi:hypothetical protein